MTVEYWLTPPDLYAQLDSLYHFDFDPCPHPMPTWDGLKVPWGKSNFVNPPHGDGGAGVGPWVRKALAERELGRSSAIILPVDHLMFDLLTAGPMLSPLPPFRWVAPRGRRTSPAPPTILVRIEGKVQDP